MTAYNDLDTPRDMRLDAAEVGAHLSFLTPRLVYTDAYAAWPTDQPKPEIEITEAAQRIAAAVFS